MAFWRTVLGAVNLLIALAIALKVFEVIYMKKEKTKSIYGDNGEVKI